MFGKTILVLTTALAAGLAFGAPAALAAETPALVKASHPLDALTTQEITAVVGILKAAGRATDDSQYPTLTLQEPDKATVRGWSTGAALDRRARVTVLTGQLLHEGVVNIGAATVESWVEVKGKFPRPLYGAFSMGPVIQKDPRFVEALKKRGYPDASKVSCMALTPGPIDNPKFAGRWIAYAPCTETVEDGFESFARPVEGLMPVVDLGSREVLAVVDLGVTPMIMGQSSLHYKDLVPYRPPHLPVEISHPEGSNFSVQGSLVKWDNWSFHMRADQREGLILSLVEFDDKGTRRPIVYEMAPSEMYVPYMDPAATWSWRAYMDVGEYGFGSNASTLMPGEDCPASARYFSLNMAGDKGEPVTKRNVVCIFEQPTGDPIWRHGSAKESRANVQLVVRLAPQVGNYDYMIDYVFNAAGDIDVRVGATGIDAVKGVAAATLSDPSAAADITYGTLIAKGLVATNHDHYISFRIDMDVDGEQNRAVFDAVTPQTLPKSSFRRSLWTTKTETIRTAGPVKFPEAAGVLRIENSARKNAMGYPTSYQIFSGHSVTSLLAPDDPIQKRAAWSGYATWLSAFDARQRSASGEYPNLDSSGDGVARWTSGRQPVDNKDLVVWQTVGFRHVPRSEDWPVMPAVWHGFRLRPVNFFDINPALDLARPHGGGQ